MSYSITVESTGGEHTVKVSGDVPEGKHVIAGHFDVASSTLSVNRLSPAGLYLASAASSHVKEN